MPGLGDSGERAVLSASGFFGKIYRWFHGRTYNPRARWRVTQSPESNQMFLATDESHGLIGEDDLTLRAGFRSRPEPALATLHLGTSCDSLDLDLTWRKGRQPGSSLTFALILVG